MLLLFCEDGFGVRHALEVSPEATVRGLKKEVANVLGIGHGKQRLLTEEGESLDDDEVLMCDVEGIGDRSTLHLAMSEREINRWQLKDKGVKRCFKSALAAAEGGLVGVLRLLKDSGVDLTQRGPHGVTLLMAGTRHQPVLDFLIASESVGDVEARDSRGNTALFLACWNENLPAAKTLVEKLGARVGARNQENDTPLIYAVMRGHCGLAQYLYHALCEAHDEDLPARVKTARRLARTFCQYEVLDFLDAAEHDRQRALATAAPAAGKSRRRERQLAKAAAARANARPL
ncbi:hypothetical protein DIPPA_17672 [Diplonema papillatum]|nr:hypothetical protein DIPPA_17672 [Diplonema papillatum]